MPPPELGVGHAAARVHHTSRWRGGVAIGGARPAGRAHAPYRLTEPRISGRPGMAGPYWGLPAGAGMVGVEYRPQRAHRHPLATTNAAQIETDR